MSLFEFGEEVIASTYKLVIDENHGDGVPFMLFAELLSLLDAWLCLGVDVFEVLIILFKVVCNLSTVWAIIASQHNNFCHTFQL